MNQKETHNGACEETRRINAEAAEWHVRIVSGAVSDGDPAYLAWLAASPAHDAAMKRARTLWASFDNHAAAPEMVKLRRDALDQSGKAAARRWSVFRKAPAYFKIAVAAALVALIGAPALMFMAGQGDRAMIAEAPAVETYRTAVAETRVVTLTDNSRISLDASTTLAVRYSDEARDIELIRGQAHFDVARDLTRPFRVTAGDQTVIATGTAFNIEMLDEEVLITLLEGEVIVADDAIMDLARMSAPEPSREIDPQALRSAPVTMKPGQLLVASVDAPPQIVDAVNIEKTNAWRAGKVFLEGDSLSAAVERMNRYSRIKLAVVDDSLEGLRISGVFDAGDTDAFIEAVEAYFPVDARRISASRIELRGRR